MPIMSLKDCCEGDVVYIPAIRRAAIVGNVDKSGQCQVFFGAGSSESLAPNLPISLLAPVGTLDVMAHPKAMATRSVLSRAASSLLLLIEQSAQRQSGARSML